MTPSRPFLPGIGTTLSGRARARATARLATATDTFHRASLCALARIFRAWLPGSILAPTVSGAHSRHRVFSLPVTFWAFLSQMLSPTMSCREALAKVIAWCALKDLELPSTNTAAYCKARAKLPLDHLHAVNTSVASTMEQRVPADGLWCGRRVLVADGTGLSMPDTPANQKKFPQPVGQKKGCGFPVVKIVALFSLASGALLAWAEGRCYQHDSRLWRVLWRILLPADVVLADRAFCSFAAIAALHALQVDCVFRLHQGRALPRFPKGARDLLSTWHKPQRSMAWTAKLWRKLPGSIVVRIVKVVIAVPGFRTTTIFLATSLLDAAKYPADMLADLYLRRWAVELFFRDIKTSMRMDVLAGQSPHMIRREIAMFAIAYNLVRALMQDAANAYHRDLSRVSFKGTADLLREWCATCAQELFRPRRFLKLYTDLISVIARDRVPLRPGRSEPRALKRRPKPYSSLTTPRHKMRVPPHRGRPQPRSRQAA
jgi:hypothetical protein